MSTTKWALDATHSEVQFKVKHLMIANVTGSFTKFEGTVETEGDDFTTAKIHLSIDVDSINTNNEQRDGHLKTGDFFDAAAHPKITFESTKLEKVNAENYKLHGNLTMKGVTKPVVLDVDFGGIGKDLRGGIRAGFSVSGKINRQDFGVNFSPLLETGELALSNDIKLHSDVQFIKQA